MESCIHCKENIQRREMVKHIEKTCPEAPKTCEFCEKDFVRKALR
jgi:TRAF-type zinc finger